MDAAGGARAAEVVGEAVADGSALEVLAGVDQLLEPRRCDGMAAGFESAAHIDEERWMPRIRLLVEPDTFALPRESKILHVDDSGDGEAVVRLDRADVAPFDPGFEERAAHRFARGRKAHDRRPFRYAQCMARHLARRDARGRAARGRKDARRRAVAYRRAVEEAQGIGYQRTRAHRFRRKFLPEVREGIVHRVAVVHGAHDAQLFAREVV